MTDSPMPNSPPGARGSPSTCQMPERFGLHSNLATGPVMVTLPSFVRGAPGVGVFVHCACSVAPAARHAMTIHVFIALLYCPRGAGFDKYSFDAASPLIGVTLSGSIRTIR